MDRFAAETGRDRGLEAARQEWIPRCARGCRSRSRRRDRRLSQFEQVKKFTILPVELTHESGELTPTLKVRRKVMAERYAREIDALYEWTVQPRGERIDRRAQLRDSDSAN